MSMKYKTVKSLAELPTQLVGARTVFLDLETTSFDVHEKALYPYAGHRACGVALTADAHEQAWYIPLRHRFSDGTPQRGNLDPEPVMRFVGDVLGAAQRWVNHNVNFDAHFLAVEGVTWSCDLVDTLVLAKLIDSGRFGAAYDLSILAHDWLNLDIRANEIALDKYLATIKVGRRDAKDYGLLPIALMAPYAACDVLTNRLLYIHEVNQRPEEMRTLWRTEIDLTSVLFDIERGGMRVDPDELRIEHAKALIGLLGLEQRLEELIGFTVNPRSPRQMYRLICDHLGLPVIAWTDPKKNKTGTSNPSFGKDVLQEYLIHPLVRDSEHATEVLTLLASISKAHAFISDYVEPYQKHQVDGRMHPSYNQSVRSGRLSCRRPNAQNLNQRAKKLIHPDPGDAFICFDYQQAEFRSIVHYIQAMNAIDAYAEDIETDFHHWVSEISGVPRKAAKNVNFATAFGGGKPKITKMLAGHPAIMEEMRPLCSNEDDFRRLCAQRAEEVYETYHRVFSTLKPKMSDYESRAKRNGYVRNRYRRRCHLDSKGAYKAFNRVIQSTIADLVKERMVALAPRFNPTLVQIGLRMCWNVHDEIGFTGPVAVCRDPEVISYLARSLEWTPIDFRVAHRVDAKLCLHSWGEGEKLEIDRSLTKYPTTVSGNQYPTERQLRAS